MEDTSSERDFTLLPKELLYVKLCAGDMRSQGLPVLALSNFTDHEARADNASSGLSRDLFS